MWTADFQVGRCRESKLRAGQLSFCSSFIVRCQVSLRTQNTAIRRRHKYRIFHEIKLRLESCTSFASFLSFLTDGLFRSQGTHVDVVYICEKSSMSSLLVCVSVAAVVVAVLTTVPGKSHHEIEFLYQLFTNTCSDAVATLCDCSFCVIQIFVLS